jgi:hypothetical protein
LEKFAMPNLSRLVSTAAVLFVVLVTSAASRIFTHPPSESANLTLWAWDRYEDLSFLKERSEAVAYYAGTIFLTDGGTLFKPRLHSLNLPEGVVVTPVFRIESRCSGKAPPNSANQEVVSIVKRYQTEHRCQKIQIDFDARQSEREFYACVLKLMRDELAPNTYITITALASWCLDDRWLAEGRAEPDEAIVMLFSMGSFGNEVLSLLRTRRLSAGGHIKISIGISANESFTNRRLKELAIFRRTDRVYIFNSLPWTQSRFKIINDEVKSR